MKRLLVVIVLMSASGAQADIYTWKDSRGISHFTNKEYEIPERYKAKAKPLNIEATQPGSASTAQQAVPQAPPQATPQAAPPNPAPLPVVRAPIPQSPVAGQVTPRGRHRTRSEDE